MHPLADVDTVAVGEELRQSVDVGDIDSVLLALCEGDAVAQRVGESVAQAEELGDADAVPLAEPHTLALPVSDTVAHADELRQSVELGDAVPVVLAH